MPAKTFEIGQMYGDIRTRIIDSAHYYFFVTTFKFNSSFKGYSGALIFLQDSASKRWRVSGILTGGMQFGIDSVIRETIIATKPELAVDIINSGQLDIGQNRCDD